MRSRLATKAGWGEGGGGAAALLEESRHERPRRAEKGTSRDSRVEDDGCRAVLRGPVLSDYVRMRGVSDLYTTVSDYTASDCG